ncbi:MAG: putative DNA binding domain-containing protein [Cyclobacteriaceae bacterium]
MALPINIEDLVHAKTVESNRIEFKKGWNPEKVIRAICAFSNDIDETGGGYVIIGIEEKDGNPVLPPAGLKASELDSIQKELVQLYHLFQPKIFPATHVVEFLSKQIILLHVLTGEERPYKAHSSLGREKGLKKVYVRSGSTNMQATPQIEEQLRELAGFKHFDEKKNPEAKIEDLDRSLIRSYLEDTKAELLSKEANLTLSDLAVKLQIASGSAENITPLNIGLLMFCKNPEKFFAGCKTRMAIFKDEHGSSFDEIEFVGPIHIQIKAILEFFQSNIIKEHVEKDEGTGSTNRYYNYPIQALKELVVNSLYHRSYANSTPNEIRVYTVGINRRIELTSYPGPLPPIDQESLNQEEITARNYRHIRLGDWLKGLRLAEKFATGIPTIRKALEDNGSPTPDFYTDSEKSIFKATLRIHPDWEDSEIETKELISTRQLSNFEQELLEACEKGPQTLDKFQIIGKKHDQNAKKIKEKVNELVEEKLLNMSEISKFLGVWKIHVYTLNDNGRNAMASSF